jgi:hypothetical protein
MAARSATISLALGTARKWPGGAIIAASRMAASSIRLGDADAPVAGFVLRVLAGQSAASLAAIFGSRQRTPLLRPTFATTLRIDKAFNRQRRRFVKSCRRFL